MIQLVYYKKTDGDKREVMRGPFVSQLHERPLCIQQKLKDLAVCKPCYKTELKCNTRQPIHVPLPPGTIPSGT